ncbi:short-chain fatty acid transporter [Hanstruepera neustonica]|uniref:Short-chain fatty acid transporter n=1 Tax=Hanstruepera neustonica TaxID=1445657 RepID=A0A2K1DWK2_9FLAO|nr:TIGR00366 family protein [Hanstruepera neustonica]PNQ72401.1 short-chain fatty acid transporter [Hanstruepera neustonica]
MITKLGEKFSYLFLKFMPDAFVFAIVLTLVSVLAAYFVVDASFITIISSWYEGFFDLLAFAMQIILILVTGFSIALSPVIGRLIDRLTKYINSPGQVYFFVVFIGLLLSLVSFGWIVITGVLARELALRVKGVNYPFLIACVYVSMCGWVTGLSSTIPLLLNSENNYLIEAGVVSNTIPTSLTLNSYLNFSIIGSFFLLMPAFMMFVGTRLKQNVELKDLCDINKLQSEKSIEEEANGMKLPFKAYSDKFNNSFVIQGIIVLMGIIYIGYYFYTKGVELNFNIMIFTFIVLGMLLHKTPLRYGIAMQRSSRNISGILFQYPFYAGIMGIMLYTGLGEYLAKALASVATVDTYAFYAFITGGLVNFAIPSAGGEFAVVGPSLIAAIQEIGTGLPEAEISAMISRASLAVAYGESLTNLLQPFFLLLIVPVMGMGTNLQSRDIMGYLVMPFMILFVVQLCLILWMPL